MADKRINQLPAGTTPLAGTEVLAIDTVSGTKQVTTQDVANLASGIPPFSTLSDAGTSFNGDWFLIDRGLTENYLRVSTHNIHGGAIASTCKNVSGGSLAKGTPVYQVSVQGQSITVAAADASDPAKMPAIGVLNETLADDAEGEIIFLGNIQGVNTNAFAAGDPVYVAVGGGYTNVRPSPPNISQYLGTVLKISANAGSGQILGTGVADPAIANLADTTITSPTNGQVLRYDNATNKWVNSALSSGGTKTLRVFTPLDNQPPATNFATLDTRNSVATLDFDAATDEAAVFVGVIPEGANLSSGLSIHLSWAATSATTGNCEWGVQVEKTTGHDIDGDGFDTAAVANTATSGTSGVINTTAITLTTIDSLAAGDAFRLRVYRDADAVGDTMTGDAELIAVEVRQVA
jgi:hypothetical protein